VSAKQIIELDAEILAAFQALEAAAPEGYLDTFEARLLARLEEDDMSETSNESTAGADERVAAAIGGEPSGGSDDAELHDIRALARSTKLRISQRMAAQVDAEETLRSASSLALRTISLPEPGKDYQTFATGEKPAAAATAHEEDAGLPAWIYAAISAVAAAAIVFFLLRGQKSDEPIQVASNEPSTALEAENLAPGGHGFGGPGTAPDGVDGAGTGAGAPDTADKDEGAAGPGAQADEGSNLSSAESNRVAVATRSGDTTPNPARRAGAGDAVQKSSGGATSADTQDEASAEKTAAKKPEKKSDALEDLLAEASGGAAGTGAAGGAAGGAQETSPAESKPTRTRLDSGDIKKAMTPVGPKAQACYDQTQLSGMVTVRIEFRVEPSGTITSAAAKGEFKGTPTGECVASAVKSATLPAYDGAPMTFTYPILLTQ
jgi:hypothetical protein